MTIGNKIVTHTQQYLASNIFWNDQNGTSNENGVTVFTSCLSGKAWNGDDDVDWRSKIANRVDATNRYVADHYFIHAIRPTYMVGSTSSDGFGHRTYSYNRAFVGSLSIDQNDVGECTNTAQIKQNKKILALVQSVDGIAFLGELTETLHMLRHPTEILVKLTHAHAKALKFHQKDFSLKLAKLKRRPNISQNFKLNEQRQRAIRSLRSQERKLASNLWLQWQYGVRPLLNDISSATDALIRAVAGDLSGVKVVSSRSVLKRNEFIEGTPFSEFNATLRLDTLNVQTTEVKLTSFVNLEAQWHGLTPLQRLKDTFKLDFTALAPAIWDLTPLSVFIDMFVNVSDVLKAGATVLPSHTSNRSLTVNKMVITDTIPLAWGNAAFFTDTVQRGRTSVSTRHYERDKWVDVIPTLTFTTPLGKPLKLASLLAFVNNVI